MCEGRGTTAIRSGRRTQAGTSNASQRRATAILLGGQLVGIGVARRRRPGELDERYDSPPGAIELADDEALLLDIGEKTLRAAQRVRTIGACDRGIARAWPTLLRCAGDHHEDALHVLRQDRGTQRN